MLLSVNFVGTEYRSGSQLCVSCSCELQLAVFLELHVVLSCRVLIVACGMITQQNTCAPWQRLCVAGLPTVLDVLYRNYGNPVVVGGAVASLWHMRSSFRGVLCIRSGESSARAWTLRVKRALRDIDSGLGVSCAVCWFVCDSELGTESG